MPQSIPKGLTREHILRALTDFDDGIAHPFGRATGYELVHQGKRYAPKAVIGMAFRHPAALPAAEEVRVQGKNKRRRAQRRERDDGTIGRGRIKVTVNRQSSRNPG